MPKTSAARKTLQINRMNREQRRAGTLPRNQHSSNSQKYGFYLDEGGGGTTGQAARFRRQATNEAIKGQKTEVAKQKRLTALESRSFQNAAQVTAMERKDKKGGRRETSTKENISLAKWAFLVWLNKSSILAFVLKKQPGPRQNSGEEHQEAGRQAAMQQLCTHLEEVGEASATFTLLVGRVPLVWEELWGGGELPDL